MKTIIKIDIPDTHEVDTKESTFEEIVIKRKESLPKSWRDMGEVSGFSLNKEGKVEYTSYADLAYNRGLTLFSDISMAVAVQKLAKLSQLMKIYNDGWKPDWTKYDPKYVIYILKDKPEMGCEFYEKYFLAFKSEELCKDFLEYHKSLIIEARALL